MGLPGPLLRQALKMEQKKRTLQEFCAGTRSSSEWAPAKVRRPATVSSVNAEPLEVVSASKLARAGARSDHPLVLPFGKVSREGALSAARTEESRAEAMSVLERDTVANSSRLSIASKLRLFEELHAAWFGPSVLWLPLTPTSVTAVGSPLKAGRYSSGANYLSAARVFSRDSGHPEHPLIPHATASFRSMIGE